MGFGFRNLEIYQALRDYVRHMYEVSGKFPVEEKYGLRSQVTRAATSVLLNFSEGMMSTSIPERKRYLQISINSIGELVAITDIAFDLHYLTPGNHEEILVESESVIKRLYGMKRKLV